ncbi:MAG TPA: hypothetical protein VGQ30_04230 [Gemmatimonadaceae bacterium]|nr:hypothetical protein [Gemmatimonadaceae bacterium]
MLTVLLAAQLAVAVPRDTATYSSPALRALVLEAVRVNNHVPAALGGYRAKLESEIAIGERDGTGHETEESLEQVASSLRWSRTGDFEQHVIGYRSQALGLQFATIGFFRNAWVVPSLYGNRLALLFGIDTTRRRSGTNGTRPSVSGRDTDPRTTLEAVHPLSVDRERLYRFSGGDTVEKLSIGDREIRIVRVIVEPRDSLPYRTVVFTGEMDLDADRKHVVRMRGSFASTSEAPSFGIASLLSTVRPTAIAFVELVNSEVNQEFWLPSYQRFEAQGMLPVMGDAKVMFRIISRFSDYAVTPPDSAVAAGTAVDTLRVRPHRLSIATRDSLSAFRAWREDIGAATEHSTTEDFVDVAPARWRAEGRPQLAIQTERFSDLAHFNRVEGLYTGLGMVARLRDASPGLTLRALGGYAWSERVARGRASAVLARGPWAYALRAGRSLDITNDFREPLDSGSSLGAVAGIDNYDYVDRYSAGGSVTRAFAKNDLLARVEAGWSDDRPTSNTLSRNPFRTTTYLANRGIDAGSYFRTGLVLTLHPDASAEYLRPGFGAGLIYLRGDGQLNFQRIELRLGARSYAGRWTFASRLDAGAVLGSPPPQQLFELGSTEGLPGYGYKQFAGNQAALLRGVAMYQLNILSAPIRLSQRFLLPAPAPALAVSLQSGWTGASNSSARESILRLGGTAQSPVSSVTGDARSTISAGIRFFGGAIGLALARALDHADRWRGQISFGQLY